MKTTFTPYRVCPLGAHVDHQLGRITGFAIDKGITFTYEETANGDFILSSKQFDLSVKWNYDNVPLDKVNDWADYLRGITIIFNNRFHTKKGLKGVFDGQFPIGGLSSSAAISISFLQALADVNGIVLTDKDIVNIAKESENNYVHVSCGKLDQSCITYCKKDSLLFLDTKDDSFKNVSAPKNIKPWKIGIFFSGVERNLASSKFNMRVDETKSAAYSLMALSHMEYGKYEDAYLRNVPYETFQKYKDQLPINFMKRAKHYYSEQDRILKGIKCWENGDIEGFGRLVSESGRSSIENYETGSSELKTLYEIIISLPGVYGARFSGAGFKGCCMAIIDPSYAEQIFTEARNRYLEIFPQYKDKYCSSLCSTVDGVGQ